jgi:hypothetical protein
LHAAAELGIADLLAAGPLPCAALAPRLNVDADALYRLMRALAAMGVFVELENRSFALNEAAQFLRSDVPRSFRDVVRYLGTEWNIRTLANTLHSVRTAQPAFDCVHGTTLFDYLAERPDEALLFDTALARLASGAAGALAASYDFASFSRVVDVGGGKGEVLAKLLRKHPQLKGVLFDRPHVIAAARANLDSSQIAERLEFVAGDFFAAVPHGADLYLLKHVIHDWDADRAVQLLSNCRHAMHADSRLLLMESILAPSNEGEFAKLMDVGMLTTTGGRERSEPEYASLLDRAGLHVLRVTATRLPYSIVEARVA